MNTSPAFPVLPCNFTTSLKSNSAFVSVERLISIFNPSSVIPESPRVFAAVQTGILFKVPPPPIPPAEVSSITLPFDNVALVEQGTWSGAPAGANNYAWLCVNQPGGTATQFATFTLGPNGAGTWQIDTCQQWFDQNQFLEVNVDIRIVGTATAFCVINQRVNDGAGDRIYQGNLVREFAAGDAVQVEVTFANGTGSNPFPSAAQNRPIEVTFTKIV